MTDSDFRFNQLIAALKERDYRLTPQRIELVRLIAVSEGHPSVSELYTKIKGQFPTMSRATVYKTLTLLKEIGQVLEIDLRDDSHYDGNRPDPHPHLVCTDCNKIMDGDLDIDLAAVRELERTSGYQITRSQVTFFGLCPDCRVSGGKENLLNVKG